MRLEVINHMIAVGNLDHQPSEPCIYIRLVADPGCFNMLPDQEQLREHISALREACLRIGWDWQGIIAGL